MICQQITAISKEEANHLANKYAREYNPAVYARWAKTNITENKFAEEGVDYFYSTSMLSEQKRGDFAFPFCNTADDTWHRISVFFSPLVDSSNPDLPS